LSRNETGRQGVDCVTGYRLLYGVLFHSLSQLALGCSVARLRIAVGRGVSLSMGTPGSRKRAGSRIGKGRAREGGEGKGRKGKKKLTREERIPPLYRPSGV
jgi:hypothetical protein